MPASNLIGFQGSPALEGITKLLPPAVRQQLFRSDPAMLELLKSLWGSMVGHGIAKQCRPIEFASGTLTIVTSCPTWAVQFRQLNDEIRGNINKFLGGEHVKRLRVRVDPAFQAPALPEAEAALRKWARPRVKITETKSNDAGDVLGILKQSYEKYFSRNDRKPD
jgi:hypothetical protein